MPSSATWLGALTTSLMRCTQPVDKEDAWCTTGEMRAPPFQAIAATVLLAGSRTLAVEQSCLWLLCRRQDKTSHRFVEHRCGHVPALRIGCRGGPTGRAAATRVPVPYRDDVHVRLGTGEEWSGRDSAGQGRTGHGHGCGRRDKDSSVQPVPRSVCCQRYLCLTPVWQNRVRPVHTYRWHRICGGPAVVFI